MRKNLLTSLIIIVALQAQAALKLTSIPTSGKVEFEAVGRPSMIKIKGLGEGVVAHLVLENQRLSGEIKFSLESLKTGIDLRDEHMKVKYLETKQHPMAVLKIMNMQMPTQFNLSQPNIHEAMFEGQLMLHGTLKSVKGVYSVNSQNLTTTASFELKLSDFGIEVPTYLGVKIADVVKVQVLLDKLNISKM